ncbi:MAG: septal ring lytic transglycosylase RlpA family protein [Acidobacteriota bacterium]|nr:septal ring lytic transglycosylase RlpA family protein [Acidobacteriota bacterium]
MRTGASIFLAGLLLAAPLERAADEVPPQELLQAATTPAPEFTQPECPALDVPLESLPQQQPAGPDPLLQRAIKYTQLALRHRVNGLASYYSSFFDGRRTANGEVYRNARYSAAHLTLPLGTWVEVTARATGRKLRLRVNDRGPYAKKFCLDLSQAAAHFLGVDVAADRHVDIRIIALPGEEPLPENVDPSALDTKPTAVAQQ